MQNEDDPFTQLLRCHRKLEERLAEVATAPFDAGLRDAFLGFLDRSIRRHEDDEEQSLFPRLAPLPELASPIAMLREEHRAQAELQRAFREAAGAGAAADAVQALRTAYAKHIQLEEAVVFPAARAALDNDVLREMMNEMQARRDRDGGGRGGGGGGGGRRRDR